MAVKKVLFGETPKNEQVFEYHITNKNNVEVVVINYGVTIKNIFVPDKNGNRVDVVLGYDKLEDYFANGCFLGSTVGPTANRINEAKYKIDGKEFTLPVNDGPNNLHTDMDNGFHKRVWDAAEGEDSVKFTLEAKDGDIGFAGNRRFEVTYKLTDDNSLSIHYFATSDANTLINMTNHAYFNLSGHNAGSIHDHVLKLNASHFTPVIDSAAIPTGEIASVKGTPFDFTTEKPVGKDIEADDYQLKAVSGYDHNFVIDEADGSIKEAAVLTSPKTGITMKCFTDLPGVQFYAGNFVEGTGCKDGANYKHRDGLCLETQFYPDSINQPDFPKPVFGPGKAYDTTTIYQFV
ncbi:MAG: galactose mutarotase [Butyrivibrio sp.]|nr:galactose mutarotase [Butyrivibrio sp.]